MLLNGWDVENLDDAGDWVHAETLTLCPDVGVVVRHDSQQRVPRLAEAYHHASPEGIDAHGAHTVIELRVELLEVDAAGRGLLKLVGKLADLLSHGGLKLCEVV